MKFLLCSFSYLVCGALLLSSLCREDFHVQLQEPTPLDYAIVILAWPGIVFDIWMKTKKSGC
jgi:hypothetical protein